MQKITEIRETYTVKRKERVNGGFQEVLKTFTRYHQVNYVSGWPRFGHYVLDYIFLLVFQFMIGATLGIVAGLTQNMDWFDSPYFDTIVRVFNWLVLNPFYYFIFEYAMQSTPGKAILGRVVVDEYGNKPSTKQILYRSLSRMVPFEIFSCLSEQGWHDTWSKTIVLRKKDLTELKLLQKVNNIGNTSISLPTEE